MFGYVSLNYTLSQVFITRKYKDVEIPINKLIKLSDYDCLAGLPYGNKHMIGKDIYFIDMNRKITKLLVVDVEQRAHYPYMKNNKLVMDTNCPNLVHLYGYIVK